MAIIAGGAILAGVIGFIVVNSIIGGKPSAHQLLAEANALAEQQNYTEAAKTYQKAAKADKTLIAAYLGQANALASANDIAGAIKTLEGALEQTGENEDLQARLIELQAMAEEIAAHEDGVPSVEEGASEIASESGGDDGQSVSGESEAALEDDGLASEPDTSSAPIVFQDKTFEKMLRKAMELSESEPISEADLAGITTLKILGETHSSISNNLNSLNKSGSYQLDGEVYTERGSIASLNDLAHFKSLRKLTIGYNHITDISGIGGISSLETLGLYNNDITDISALSGLTNLKYLYIYDNNISNILPLANSTALQQIWVDNNKIGDISPLKNLTGLTEIYINNNEVADISPISGLSKLAYFCADNNQITDISAMQNLASLSTVSLSGNKVSDFSPANHVKTVRK